MVWSEAVGCSATASWWPGRGRPSPGNTHLTPESAVQVEIVAPGLPGGRVADVGVQRMPVVGELGRAVGSLDRADPARYAPAARAIAGEISAGNLAGALVVLPAGAGASVSAARTTKAATSTTPATMPAVVRTSVNPNSPIHTDSRYPPRAAITCRRKSQPIVGIDR